MIRTIRWFLLAGSFCFLVGCVSHTAFEGGQLTKIRLARFFSDYLAQFPPLDLNKNGHYTAEFRGFPASPAYLDLNFVNRSVGDKVPVRRFTSEILMELENEDGSKVCKATGKLNEVKWEVAASGDSASFFNSDCLGLKIHRNKSYTLEITVTGANESQGPLLARPRLYTLCC